MKDTQVYILYYFRKYEDEIRLVANTLLEKAAFYLTTKAKAAWQNRDK